jgi:hypothetical protein
MLKNVGQLRHSRSVGLQRDWSLWRSWVVANALGELIGLGAAGAIGAMLASIVGATSETGASLGVAGALIVLGTLEGLVVGLAQWLVLRRPFPGMRRRSWMLASAAGAFVAWALGMLPSTLADVGAAAGEAAPVAISDTMMYALAAAMGAVLGSILGFPQWLALRRHARRAIWWVPANAVAWAVGMPVVFIGASAPPAGGVPGIVMVALLTAGIAGAVVGATHGLVLIWLAQPPDRALS